LILIGYTSGILRTQFEKNKDIQTIYKFSDVYTLLMKNMQWARYECKILDLAKAYDGYSFYFPAFLDFRGRIYRNGIFHFHERDLARSLLLFYCSPNESDLARSLLLYDCISQNEQDHMNEKLYYRCLISTLYLGESFYEMKNSDFKQTNIVSRRSWVKFCVLVKCSYVQHSSNT